MMESSESKKRIFYMIVLVLTLLTMIIGATLAYFSLIASQKKDSTVLYTGKLEINYIDGIYIKDPILIPMGPPTYETYKNVYRNSFSVASSGTLDQTISVELEVSTNEFSEDAIKYALYNQKGDRISIGNVPKEGMVTLAKDIFLNSTGTAKYTLIIWLDKKDYDQNFEMGHIISGKINIHSKQLKY